MMWGEPGPLAPDALERLLSSPPIGEPWPLVDIRSRAAYLRGHVGGAVSIPWPRLARSQFLLPPREGHLIVLARDGPAAAAAARYLREHGRAQVSWLSGSPQDLPSQRLRSGWEPNRLWEPSELLHRFVDRLPHSGEAADLACGSGREAAFLALRRPRVLGVDILPDALRQARTLASEAGVASGRLSLRRVDLADPQQAARLLRPGRFQVILCFRYLDRSLVPVIVRALARGGWLLYETFLEAQAQAGRKPTRPEHLLRPGELRRALRELEVIHYHEGPDPRGDHLASAVARRGRGPDIEGDPAGDLSG